MTVVRPRINLPSRGEIWMADLNPTRGHEENGGRPVLILSTDTYNHGPAGLIIVAPLTRTNRGIPWHIAVNPPEGGLNAPSYILCDAVRSIAKERLRGHAFGVVTRQTMSEVEDSLRILLEL